MDLEKYTPTWSQAAALGRHAVTSITSQIGGATAALVALHAIGPDQAQMIVDYVSRIVHDATDMVEATTGLVALGMGVWASWTSRPKGQIAAAAAVPGVEKIVVSPTATGPAADAAADPALPTVKKGLV